MSNIEHGQIHSKTKIRAYFYNQSKGTFFVHDITYKPTTEYNIFKVGVTLYPSVNGLMNRVFKRYRKGKFHQCVVLDAMKVLDYDEEFEMFTIYENDKKN